MKVYNEDKTVELTEYDLTKGYLDASTLTTHFDAVEAVEEQGHYITIAEYPNGGKDVEWVVDVPGVKAVEEHDETEDIYIYIPYTKDELEANALREELWQIEEWFEEHDYIGVKIATGRASVEDYKDEIAEMSTKATRKDEINARLEELA